jgi:hypothetical protein
MPVTIFLVKIWQLGALLTTEFGTTSLIPVSIGFNVDGQLSGLVEVIGC